LSEALTDNFCQTEWFLLVNCIIFIKQNPKKMPINKETLSPGNGTLTLNGTRLRPGSYQYTLWVNGEKTISKTMIIVK
jgi:hypothetical protein